MVTRAHVLVGSLLCAALAYACSDEPGPAVTSDGGADAGRPPPSEDDSGLPPLVSDDAGPGTLDAGTNVSGTDVLINEISGGDEWVELVNAGSSARDLAGWKLADRDKTTGAPKLSEALAFPAGTTLAAGAYAIVRGGGVGPAAKPCPGPDAGGAGDGGDAGASPVTCFHAEFGISNKDGETLFLLAPDGSVAGKVVYPMKASSGSTSYSRIPSGVADAGFTTVAETPGAANVE